MTITTGTLSGLVLASRRQTHISRDRVSAPEAGATCIANIGPRERRQRLNFGLQAMAFGAALALVLILIHADVAWRLLLFVPFSAGASGYFQARDKT